MSALDILTALQFSKALRIDRCLQTKMAENHPHPLRNDAAKEEVTFYLYISLAILVIQVATMFFGKIGLLIFLVCVIGYAFYLRSQGERPDNPQANQQTRSETFKSRARVDVFVFISGLIGMLYVIIILLIFVRPIAVKMEQANGNKQQEEEILKTELQESWYRLVVAAFASLWMVQIQAVSNIAFIIMIYNLVQACCI